MVPFRNFYWTRVIIISVLILSLMVSPALASQLDTKRRELGTVKSKIETNRRKISAAEKRQAEVLQEIELNDQKIGQLQKEIDDLELDLERSVAKRRQSELKLSRLESDLGATETKLAAAEEELTYKREIFNKRIAGLYKGSKIQALEMVLSSRNLGDLIDRVSFLQVIAESDAKLVKEMERIKNAVENRRNKLRAERKVIAKQRLFLIDEENHMRAVKNRIAMKQQLFRDEFKRQEAILARVEREKKRLKYSEDVLESTSNMIASQIRTLERGGSISVSRGLGRRVSSGSFIRPTQGRITSRFGWRFHPILRRPRLHAGIDFGVGTGTPVCAAQSGTVIMAGRMGGYGNTVVISHGNGLTSLYAHNSRILVRRGQYVKRGATVARSGSTGLSTGPHVHFEIRVNGVPRNPMNWIN
ncbi:MAG TPA: peptidoglycan DD-metalloendopeptidase family protein [Anaerolineae bacterium]|jgi:murein DD-endopeptidase MepM/ murein hydrolase activator NlpD|nr:peptidoglycan DD-metalloendopeptidase family protein [Anaerolineae bacterium]